jgi:hypothetical protein
MSVGDGRAGDATWLCTIAQSASSRASTSRLTRTRSAASTSNRYGDAAALRVSTQRSGRPPSEAMPDPTMSPHISSGAAARAAETIASRIAARRAAP